MLSARAIALGGVGFGARALAFDGFTPLEVVVAPRPYVVAGPHAVMSAAADQHRFLGEASALAHGVVHATGREHAVLGASTAAAHRALQPATARPNAVQALEPCFARTASMLPPAGADAHQVLAPLEGACHRVGVASTSRHRTLPPATSDAHGLLRGAVATLARVG